MSPTDCNHSSGSKLKYCDNDVFVFSPTCVVESFLHNSEQGMRIFLMNETTLCLGLLLVLQYHLTIFVPKGFYFRKYSSKSGAVRLFGRNLVVLVLYYSDFDFMGGRLRNPFLVSLGFIFIDTVVLWFSVRAVAKCVHIEAPRPRPKKKCIMSRYTDWSASTGATALVFLAQFGLFLLFVMYLNEDEQSHDPCNVVIFQWLIGVLLTNIAGADETGVPFNYLIWKKIYYDWERSSRSIEQSIPHELKKPRLVEFGFRVAFDFVVNSFCREVLLGLAPVVLSVSDRWDFVKDCLAIFFISRLDDLDDHKSLDESIKGWMVSQQHDEVAGSDEEDDCGGEYGEYTTVPDAAWNRDDCC